MSEKEVYVKNFTSKRAQVTIFIILAVIILAAVAAYIIFRNSISVSSQIPPEFQPVYNSFLSCIQDAASSGANVMESQGGYIYLPSFDPGSIYMPFSSQLNFLGNPIPYWYYVSGNNIQKQQVPILNNMQSQLAQFIDDKIRDCNFDSYSDFAIQMGTPQASVTINSNNIQVNLKIDLNINKGNDTILLQNHKVTVNSELGNLYQSAQKIYNYEQSKLFLENYTVDALELYAPVDGVDIKCSPDIWNSNDVITSLQQAIQDNIQSLTTNGNSYFTVHVPVKDVTFLTSSNWSSSYEINPSQGNLLISQPIGNQAGLGIIGFCYVPYHFVYNINYPVLVLIRSGNEIFQFPMAVIVQNNAPRQATFNGTAISSQAPQLCTQVATNTETVTVTDSNSNPIDANLSYECFGQTCSIGVTTNGMMQGQFPQCNGGYILSTANGYADTKTFFTTTQTGSINVIMNKAYNETINLLLGGQTYRGNAIIGFTTDSGTQTIIYPQQNTVNLSEGQYNISVYIYQNSSITLGATTTQQCVDVPTGILGTTQQQCFNVNIPSQVVSNALSGGGQSSNYIFESTLQNSKTIQISAPSLPAPTSLTQLQNNYIAFQNQNLTISFE